MGGRSVGRSGAGAFSSINNSRNHNNSSGNKYKSVNNNQGQGSFFSSSPSPNKYNNYYYSNSVNSSTTPTDIFSSSMGGRSHHEGNSADLFNHSSVKSNSSYPGFQENINTKEDLKNSIRQQLEYYFSVENLCKDMYMRQQMDINGYVPLSTILKFKRMKLLIKAAEKFETSLNVVDGEESDEVKSYFSKIVSEALKNSEIVEMNSNDSTATFKDIQLRKRYDWKNWLNPADMSWGGEKSGDNEESNVTAADILDVLGSHDDGKFNLYLYNYYYY